MMMPGVLPSRLRPSATKPDAIGTDRSATWRRIRLAKWPRKR